VPTSVQGRTPGEQVSEPNSELGEERMSKGGRAKRIKKEQGGSERGATSARRPSSSPAGQCARASPRASPSAGTKSTASPCRVSVSRALCTLFERAWRTPTAQMDVSARPRFPTALRHLHSMDTHMLSVSSTHASPFLPKASAPADRHKERHPASTSTLSLLLLLPSRLALRRHPPLHKCTSPQSSRDPPANPETKEKPPRRKRKPPQKRK
jgi:hypothetical protein